jgi:hypothetical protein
MSEDVEPILDHLEMLNGFRNMAEGTRAIYISMIENGFEEAEAMRLTAAYLHGLAGGKLS